MTSWDIMREMDSLRKDLDDVFRNTGFRRPFGGSFIAPLATRRFPRVNLSEDEDNLYVDVVLPGVASKDIDLSVMRNSITINGERKQFFEEKGHIVHRDELGYGTFSRTLDLPADVDPDKVHAECKNGIMIITLGKAEHAKPKRIDIKIS